MSSSTSASALSQTLQSITLTKIRELEKQRHAYETRKAQVLAEADRTGSQHDRLALLLAGVNELIYNINVNNNKSAPSSTDSKAKAQAKAQAKDPVIANIQRWLDQARYDSSIPKHVLRSFEDQLRSKLEIQSRKLSLADLYSRLLTEWMDPSTTSASTSTTASSKDSPSSEEEGEDDDDFELVEERQKQRLQQLCEQFEAVVFTPLETDEAAIHAFMRGLFPDDDEGAKALENLRERIRDRSTALLAEEAPFTEDSLKRCIKGLLTENLLSDEKQAILRDFLHNRVALAEIADVLNMRYADIRNWDWHAGEDGIPVMPRQQLNGKYRIWMDEDVLQTIFVQYVGIRLCNLLKAVLKDFISQGSVWNWTSGAQMTQRDIERRQYYLGHNHLEHRVAFNKQTVENKRKTDYIDTFFLSQLPARETSLYERGGGGRYDDDDDDDGDGDGKKTAAESGIKQRLLRKIATEVLLHRRLHGKVAIVQSDLQWYATSLAHSTLFTVMRFMGFPEDWITFFTKYLEAPLNMDRASDGRVPMGPRIRKRGVPMAHSSEKFLGELVLFVLDLAINRETGMLLYRLHDDIWVCGEPQKCARAWDVMQRFAKVMGLEYNKHKTGSVYLTAEGIPRDAKVAAALPPGPVTIGFLTLDEKSGSWVIDQKQVDAHVAQLRKQLNACDSVLSWVQTWNSCIGRFFSHTFGEPAYCFGRRHVDAILETYERMQRTLFDGHTGNVTEHLKRMIRSRFGVADNDIPDAFFFVPEEFGGLGLRNPFISLFLVRDQLGKSPEKRLADFFTKEREDYLAKKKEFDELPEQARRRRFNSVYPEGTSTSRPAIRGDELDTFLSLDEYARFRETASADLHDLYDLLMDVPPKRDIELTREVRDALDQQQQRVSLLDSTKKWILQMYSGELFAACGGLSLVEKRYLPVGVLAMMRGKKVTWQTVL